MNTPPRPPPAPSSGLSPEHRAQIARRAYGDSAQAELRWFAYAHLQDETMSAMSKLFADLAHELVRTAPPGAQLLGALRRLLEAKDCAVRAVIEGRS